ncbi:hypothetical protein TCDM_13405 [Trypanosoma cruzi Dm28c]|uniref:Uncharacterized protein n=1 Tax=Trypanosoma cruzi Dm28c TaxID=1416333 RepID=V5AIS1_TRYCR|nr:hypothetical protein TCDM_13405 [Trypanosoma cruzi Dm28c]
MDGSIYPQPDRLEATCCLTTCVDNGELLVRDCGLNPQQFHTGGGRDHNFGLAVAPRTARADPHRAFRFFRTRGQDALDTIKLCRTQRKAHESDGCTGDTSSGSLECHGAFHKMGSVEARCCNRGDTRFGSTRDLAVGGARRSVRPSPEHSSIFGELHHNADPGAVAGRIDMRGETTEGQEPWLRAEERFSMILITTMLLQ